MARRRKANTKFYIVTVREVSEADYANWNEGEALPSDTNVSENAEHLWETSLESEDELFGVTVAFGDPDPTEEIILASEMAMF